ncbi:hypothetical protein [Deinococcus hopiensis]|uniref:Uncharacterized protein n=1 Tax=Deinococcus hopiensis KR-140 TaxID=695939 RepID=A0A1W1VL84_9DEIO|nr:hypothetical protein [Deinococcus hopiensis]SMB94117.1 hypothetical protein SAMN00790413_02249 [Deinococcus hopiensis KR-140]
MTTGRDRKLTRARWAEAVFTVIAGLGVMGLALRPSLLPLFLTTFTLVTLALMGWQYRLMDEFRRARYLKAWAATGVTGFLTLTGLILWTALEWRRGAQATSPSFQVAPSVWALYVSWTTMLVTFFGATAYLYRRDVTPAVRADQRGYE